MKIDSKVFALFLVGLLNPGSSVARDTYDCPRTVRLASGSSVAPEDVPAGYESWVSDSIIHLSGYNLYDGPPKDRAQLKGSEPSKGGVATWTLTPGKYPQGVWISCDYKGGLVKIVKRAKDPVTFCTAVATEQAEPYKTIAVRFVCK